MKLTLIALTLALALTACGEQTPSPQAATTSNALATSRSSRDTSQRMHAPAPLTAEQMGFGKRS
jgi:hypothetical protein